MNLSEAIGQQDALEFAGNMVERHDFQDQAPSLLEVCKKNEYNLENDD